ncbi:autoinducer 2 (AI-2) kinase [Larkinella arboricola]|uniref:Autoinducer 2 (AI-2) kinase n=1 Tax=Larkinella arboricola TaxID=643671 RepID=A0A327WT16_LARAB|nr:FGGY family carbohydrate kinase [Larkinella arboricola]RAJ95768.1 autoinducer 2 (AI-2) kinase [Larkinella arboricola]
MGQDAYLIIDVGTGNVRVAVVEPSGTVLGVARADMPYERDEAYPESIYFDPDHLWQLIVGLAKTALADSGTVQIRAITATSQREGIVAIGKAGQSLIGMPNIDHRGREWEDSIADKNRVYQLAGRYPTSLFSALKLVGLRERRKALWSETATFLSISDWVQYQLSGTARYEHSQASETLLYDVAAKQWSAELCGFFDLDTDLLPPLQGAGTVLGPVLPGMGAELGIPSDAQVVVGGADTQLAIRSLQPSVDDVVIVSGTTTPIIKLVDQYLTDEQQRTWTNRHIDETGFILETNAGVTGLNYQRLKAIFYPNESYEVIETELAGTDHSNCVAALGSLLADEKTPLIRGGFLFNTPVSHQLTRADFVRATLWDMACSIYENYRSLCAVTPHTESYVWTCGGGMQSRTLRQYLANLTQKTVRIRNTYQQASVVGGAFLCNDALGISGMAPVTEDEVQPEEPERFQQLYEAWKKTRNVFKTMQ